MLWGREERDESVSRTYCIVQYCTVRMDTVYYSIGPKQNNLGSELLDLVYQRARGGVERRARANDVSMSFDFSG